MWSQNWQLYQKLILPVDDIDLDVRMRNLNWTSVDMVKRADDFYRSLSLPPMTNEFWTRSIFQRNDNSVKCHGTAANMYQPNDYRMIACAAPTIEDFHVIVHEMGHLQYYMAFAEQPTIYQDGNAAIQESIGDAIFLGMMTPHHLNRLQLLSDKELFAGKSCKVNPSLLKSLYSNPMERKNPANSNHIRHNKRSPDEKMSKYDLMLLLRMALSKIPQIPFQYIMDIYRWNLFNQTITMDDANIAFWKLATNAQGIHPPDKENRQHVFDAGAKFHVADNTPFVRLVLPVHVSHIKLTESGISWQVFFGQFRSSADIQRIV